MPAQKAQIMTGGPLAVTDAGDIYFGWRTTLLQVMYIDASTGLLNTFAGIGSDGNSGDHGPALHAQFGLVTGMAIGPQGDLYVADQRYNVVRVISHQPDHTISTVAGTGTPAYDGDGGLATRAHLNSPAAIAFDKAGDLYIADAGNHVIRRVSGGMITTVAGTTRADASFDGTLRGTSVGEPEAMTFDQRGGLYVVDWLNHRILRFEARRT